jgi:hypothetical protein
MSESKPSRETETLAVVWRTITGEKYIPQADHPKAIHESPPKNPVAEPA